eukprot:CAMPEP_0196660284 /NCGR_PEP_ID=MMETSP1086-20130531/38970_1 /TAXON_ID=77921 /ORGANISM="Cyanoptyche  gloeocystis , Strain SAG4.97" /LENGTH=191 /DNA_ID=CAMNT_0041994615 /DNA_START=126 /DNA_END=701 /DNA_ORIENTATION=-
MQIPQQGPWALRLAQNKLFARSVDCDISLPVLTEMAFVGVVGTSPLVKTRVVFDFSAPRQNIFNKSSKFSLNAALNITASADAGGDEDSTGNASTVSITQFLELVALRVNVPKKDIKAVFNATLEEIVSSVAAGHRVKFPGFGTFEPRDRKARKGRNPRTGEDLEIAASRVPVFSAGRKFKEATQNSKGES